MYIATAILSVLLALAFAGASFPKISGQDAMASQLLNLGVSGRFVRVIGALEALGAAGLIVGLWIGALGVAAAACLALLMAGAVATHIKAHDTAKNTVGSAVLLVLSAVTAALALAAL